MSTKREQPRPNAGERERTQAALMATTQVHQAAGAAKPLRMDETGGAPSRRRSGKVLAAPATMNTLVMSQFARCLGELDIAGLMKALIEETTKVQNGDLSYVEAMLIAQATTLQTVFASLLLKASSQDQLKHWESYMRLGLKAQNQCRMTLETLAAIKNPPVIFARQANIANGPQQVNNSVASESLEAQAGAPAGKFLISKSELLEARDEQRVDPGTTRTAVGVDTAVEALGKVHRPAKRRR
jgi:hypothetical protein